MRRQPAGWAVAVMKMCCVGGEACVCVCECVCICLWALPVCSTLPHSRCSSLLPLPSVSFPFTCFVPRLRLTTQIIPRCESDFLLRRRPPSPPLHSPTSFKNQKSSFSRTYHSLVVFWLRCQTICCILVLLCDIRSSEVVRISFFYTRLPSITGLLFIRQLILALNAPLFAVGSTHRAWFWGVICASQMKNMSRQTAVGSVAAKHDIRQRDV